MHIERRASRTIVEIPVTVSTVLQTSEANIADLSEHGALIHGCSVEAGHRFQIDYLGQTIFAQCQWAEVDRIGAKFLFELNEGPLYERLMLARADGGMPMAFVPMPGRFPGMGGRTFGRRG